ncbi:MAG: hypothetical protein R2695_16610 [Acidimicrobiales bacterium]
MVDRGIGLWQIAEVSTAEADAHRLWDGDAFTQIKQLADVQGGDVKKIEEWVRTNYMILNLGFLDEANTYVAQPAGEPGQRAGPPQGPDARPGPRLAGDDRSRRPGVHHPSDDRPRRVDRLERRRRTRVLDG